MAEDSVRYWPTAKARSLDLDDLLYCYEDERVYFDSDPPDGTYIALRAKFAEEFNAGFDAGAEDANVRDAYEEEAG